jgi:hypothetical protein
MVLQRDKAREIKWWELGVVALACGGGIISFPRFLKLNPGWGQVGRWPVAAWMMGAAALVCVVVFLAATYRFYFVRRYGRLAPGLFAGFILLHVAGGFLVITRMG